MTFRRALAAACSTLVFVATAGAEPPATVARGKSTATAGPVYFAVHASRSRWRRNPAVYLVYEVGSGECDGTTLVPLDRIRGPSSPEWDVTVSVWCS